MRLCVRWLHVCAGKETRTLRKSAFWARALTEKRSLCRRRHGKAHFMCGPSRKSAFCVWASPKGTLCTLCMRAVVAPRGHFRRSVYTPASLRLPATAQQRAQVPHSATGDSRKDALWGCHSHGKAHSGAHWLGRVRLSVRPDSKPRSANPRASRPAAWRGVARAHLPS